MLLLLWCQAWPMRATVSYARDCSWVSVRVPGEVPPLRLSYLYVTRPALRLAPLRRTRRTQSSVTPAQYPPLIDLLPIDDWTYPPRFPTSVRNEPWLNEPIWLPCAASMPVTSELD